MRSQSLLLALLGLCTVSAFLPPLPSQREFTGCYLLLSPYSPKTLSDCLGCDRGFQCGRERLVGRGQVKNSPSSPSSSPSDPEQGWKVLAAAEGSSGPPCRPREENVHPEGHEEDR
jgi:hypothetical protein